MNQAGGQPNKGRKMTTGYIARIGVLGAIAAILYVFPEIPIIPPIYKLDFSTVPALLGGFSMGPLAGLLVLLIKDLSGLLHTTTMGIGEIADFLMSGAFIVLATIVYARRRNFKGAVIGMLFGILAMAVAGALTNYYILIPFYIDAFHMTTEGIVGMVAGTIPAVDSIWKLILLATVPFNLLKGLVLCLVTMLVYKRLSPLLQAKR